MYVVYLAKSRLALESDISPMNTQNPSATLSNEDISRINNENKEMRFLVRIDRIKVRNVGNYSNVFCKIKFADKIPMKVVVCICIFIARRTSFPLLERIGDRSLLLITLLPRD